MSLDETTIYAEFNASNHFTEVYSCTTQRVRRILFPEIMIDDDDLTTNVENEGFTKTTLFQFYEPTRKLKESIIEFLSIRSHINEASNSIPQFIQILNANDQNEVEQAVMAVHQLSKQGKVIVSLASSEPLVNALIKVLNSSNDETKCHVAAALSHISAHQIGANHIFRSGGIAELVRMLRCPILTVINYAVTTLHHLLIYVEMAKEEAIACGALEAFVPLLAPQTVIPQSGPNPKLQALVADSLYFLLLDRPQCKLTFLSLQGPRYLVEILNTETSYIKLIYAVVRCIRSISTCRQNKASLTAIGGLELLHRAFKLIDEDKRKLAALNALRNLSDVATNLETLTPLVVDLIHLIAENRDDELVGCACGILSNLTCNNNLNKQTVCTNNGIAILARALSEFGNIEDVTEPALCTLRHCTVRHPLAQQAQNELRMAYPIILALLSTGRPPIVKASLGLVRNCSLTNENLQLILKEKTPDGHNVLTLAVKLLEESGKELADEWTGLREGVSLLEMVEGAISALHQLARNPMSAAYIINRPLLMNLLIDLMSNENVIHSDDELLLREIMGLIYQLAKSKEGANAVMAYEAEPHISAALSSHHKSIAAYSTIILKNMGMNPQKIRNYNNFASSDIGCYNNSNNNGYYNGGTLERMDGNREHQMGWLNDGMEPELYNELYNYPPSLGEMRQDHIEGNRNNGSWFDTDL